MITYMAKNGGNQNWHTLAQTTTLWTRAETRSWLSATTRPRIPLGQLWSLSLVYWQSSWHSGSQEQKEWYENMAIALCSSLCGPKSHSWKRTTPHLSKRTLLNFLEGLLHSKCCEGYLRKVCLWLPSLECWLCCQIWIIVASVCHFNTGAILTRTSHEINRVSRL